MSMAGETLSRRERQIMDLVYARGDLTAAEVRDGLPDPPSYSAVRALLRVLEEKGHLKHRKQGQRYVYFPVVDRRSARRSALRHVLSTFFDGSVEQVVATLLETSGEDMSDEQYEKLTQAIEKARREGH